MNSHSSRPVGPETARRPRRSPGRFLLSLSLSLSGTPSEGEGPSFCAVSRAWSFRAVAVAVVGSGGSGQELGIGVVWLPRPSQICRLGGKNGHWDTGDDHIRSTAQLGGKCQIDLVVEQPVPEFLWDDHRDENDHLAVLPLPKFVDQPHDRLHDG